MRDNSATRAKVVFLFTKLHKLPFSTLSFNISREVCGYLDSLPLYPSFSHSSMIVHDLNLGTSHTHSLSESFAWQVTKCFIDWQTVICIAAVRQSCTIDLMTARITLIENMHTPRDSSGVIRAGSFVYVFGGRVGEKIEWLADKYGLEDGHWQQIPSLRTPKFAFTPCKLKQQIYLAEIDSAYSSLDVFCTLSETYTSYPFETSSCMNGCVSFISSGELVLLTIGGQRVRWNLEEMERTPLAATFALVDDNDAYSNCEPMTVGGNMFWVNYWDGKLIKYSLTSGQLTNAG